MSTDEDEGTDQVRSCLACSVEGSTLCSRCPEHDILYCSALSMTISLSCFPAKFSSIWSWIKGHLKSRAYGLVFPAVSVDNVLEQSVRQLPAHVAKTLEMNLIDFENWDCLIFVFFPLKLYYLAQFFTVKPDKGEVLQGGNLLCFFNILVVNLQSSN